MIRRPEKGVEVKHQHGLEALLELDGIVDHRVSGKRHARPCRSVRDPTALDRRSMESYDSCLAMSAGKADAG